MKRCFKCGTARPLSQFYTHPRMADGHLNKCKECTKRDMAIRFLLKREEIRAYDRSRQKSNRRRSLKLEYQRRSRLRSPEKHAAREALGIAVRDGRVQRRPCEICGSPDTEAHHEDYSRPLDVRWLCFKHHRIFHGQRPAEKAG